jgi:RNA polymerase sigma factor (sigma-70 family)
VISVQEQPTDEVRLRDPTTTETTAAVGPEAVMAEITPDEAVRGYLAAALRLARLLVSDGSAEDIAAESVARLLAAGRRVQIDNADAYLRRIVVNQVVGRHRRFATERRLGHRFATAASSADSGDQIVGRETLALALAQLPARQRAVLVLRYYEDLSEAAVAEMLKIPIGTVKSNASRGLEDLRRLLEEGRGDG